MNSGTGNDPDRVFIVGQSGAGKTTWIKSHTEQAARLLVWDWRGEYDLPAVTDFDTLGKIMSLEKFRVRFTPNPLGSLAKQFEALGLFCLLHSQAVGFSFVVDEAYLVTPNYQEGYLGKMLRLSRPREIELLLSSQRPTMVPGIFLSESKRLIAFHLQNDADLQTLSRYVGQEIFEAKKLKKFEFLEFPLSLA